MRRTFKQRLHIPAPSLAQFLHALIISKQYRLLKMDYHGSLSMH